MPVGKNSYVKLAFFLLAFREIYYFIYSRKDINYFIFLVWNFSDYFILIWQTNQSTRVFVGLSYAHKKFFNAHMEHMKFSDFVRQIKKKQNTLSSLYIFKLFPVYFSFINF